MKIMILVPSFDKCSPIEGAFLFAKYLHEHDRDILFASLYDSSRLENNMIDDIVKAGINYKCFNIKGWSGLVLQRFRLQEYVKSKGIDVIVSSLLRADLFIYNLPCVVKISSVRGMLRKQYSLLYSKVITNIILYFQIKSLKRMDHIWSMTKPMSEWLVSEGVESDRISIVNNFVDVKSICSSVCNKRLKHNMNINIGMLCRLMPRKRIETAIKAVGKLVHDYKHSNVRLQIAGRGKLYGELKYLTEKMYLEDNVFFNGFLEKPLSFIEEMDLILLTSEAEGMPRCLMEALSLGKTIIAADIPGVNDLIQDKKTGYLFPVGDVEKLASLIDSVIKNRLYLPSERLVNHMLENYDVSSICESMLGKIDQLYSIKET